MPREADLRDDVDAIARYAQDADRWFNRPQKLFADLRGSDPRRRTAYREVATTLFDQYRTARTQGGINDVLWIWAKAGADARSGLGQVKLSELVDPEG